jgi:hypothetical protein
MEAGSALALRQPYCSRVQTDAAIPEGTRQEFFHAQLIFDSHRCNLPELHNVRPSHSCASAAKDVAFLEVSAQIGFAVHTSPSRAEGTPAGHSFIRHRLGGVSA